MSRIGRIHRTTNETDIALELNLDGTGASTISTGNGFFDHLLTHVAKHGSLNVTLTVKGDLHVDEHHTVEDTGICVGKAIAEALGDKRGIERFGAGFVPMDEALARTIIDLSGRSYLVFHAPFTRDVINGFALEMIREFFRAVAAEARMNLHVSLLYGGNAHHQAEALFKSFGRALRQAVRVTGDGIPSTKGVL